MYIASNTTKQQFEILTIWLYRMEFILGHVLASLLYNVKDKYRVYK